LHSIDISVAESRLLCQSNNTNSGHSKQNANSTFSFFSLNVLDHQTLACCLVGSDQMCDHVSEYFSCMSGNYLIDTRQERRTHLFTEEKQKIEWASNGAIFPAPCFELALPSKPFERRL
jgi:hypothetical protein